MALGTLCVIHYDGIGGSVAESFEYGLFGLQIRSEIELPELVGPEPTGEPDVDIIIAPIPEVGERDIHFAVDGVGAYWIGGGAKIVVQPERGAAANNVRLYLLGSAMGALLHQRGDLPLHANAIEIGGKAFAFLGPSGAGKSTLAAAFHDRGIQVIADDVCVVRFMPNGTPVAWSGIPRLRLWEEALRASGRLVANYRPSYTGDPSFRKFDVPVGCQKRKYRPAPISALFLLAEGSALAARGLHGIDAIEAIYANTYRGSYAATAGTTREHWDSSIKLVRTTPVYLFERSLGFEAIGEQCDFLLNFIEATEGVS